LSVADGVMDVLFVVSRDEPWRYEYLKDLQNARVTVVLDRRGGERRQNHQPPLVERRRTERRHYPAATTELQSTGWVVVRRTWRTW